MKYSLIAILLFSFTALQAQVKGTVKDNLGNPIAGANLFWQGTTQGTTTSADGTFSLSKPNDKHMLVVSFIGFENDTIHVSNRNETLDIVLREGVELSEVNVVSRKSVSYTHLYPSLLILSSRNTAMLWMRSAMVRMPSGP